MRSERPWRLGVIIVAAALLSLSLRSERILPAKPFTEDGYYALTIARNIALGRGVTIDGVTRTNGFQPLFTFVCAGLFALAGGDRMLALRYILLIEALVSIATALLLGRITSSALAPEGSEDRRRLFWLTALVYLAGLFNLRQHANGLETGLLLLMYCAAWRYYQTGRLRSWPGRLGFGALLGLVVLTRIDAVFLVTAAVLGLLAGDRESSWWRRTLRAATVGGAAVAVSSPWWIYNWIYFGSLLPSSGRAEQDWALSLTRVKLSWFALLQTLPPWLYLGSREWSWGAAAFRLLLVAPVLIYLVWRRQELLPEGLRREGRPELRRGLEFGGVIIVTVFLLVLWYTLSSFASHFYHRYYAPLALPAAAATAGLVFHLIRGSRRSAGLVPVLIAPALLTVACFQLGWGFAGARIYEDQLKLIQRFVPEAEYVAADQTGTIGFFRDRVVNLDGKVNAEALAYRGRGWQYLQEHGIRWFCDTRRHGRSVLGKDPGARGWRVTGTEGPFVLYHR